MMGGLATGVSLAQDNQSDVQQKGEENSGIVVQEGTINTANILQGIGGTADFNEAVQTQIGDKNEAFIDQGTEGGEAYYNVATQTQKGDENSADIDQGTRDGYAEGNTATQTQETDYNTAVIDQGDDDGEAYDNVATQTQTGEEN